MGDIPWLFTATFHGDAVVVKFARSHYGTDVHKFLAHHRLAPQLLHTALLPGKWHVVVMEEIRGSPLQAPSEQVQTAVRGAVDKMAAENYVHGDLRPQNILVVNDSMRLLDFDWAGQQGEVRYPHELNTSCDWQADVQPGGLIAPVHDVYQITALCRP